MKLLFDEVICFYPSEKYLCGRRHRLKVFVVVESCQDVMSSDVTKAYSKFIPNTIVCRK